MSSGSVNACNGRNSYSVEALRKMPLGRCVEVLDAHFAGEEISDAYEEQSSIVMGRVLTLCGEKSGSFRRLIEQLSRQLSPQGLEEIRSSLGPNTVNGSVNKYKDLILAWRGAELLVHLERFIAGDIEKLQKKIEELSGQEERVGDCDLESQASETPYSDETLELEVGAGGIGAENCEAHLPNEAMQQETIEQQRARRSSGGEARSFYRQLVALLEKLRRCLVQLVAAFLHMWQRSEARSTNEKGEDSITTEATEDTASLTSQNENSSYEVEENIATDAGAHFDVRATYQQAVVLLKKLEGYLECLAPAVLQGEGVLDISAAFDTLSEAQADDELSDADKAMLSSLLLKAEIYYIEDAFTRGKRFFAEGSPEVMRDVIIEGYQNGKKAGLEKAEELIKQDASNKMQEERLSLDPEQLKVVLSRAKAMDNLIIREEWEFVEGQ